MKNNTQNFNIQYLICPSCSGSGLVDNKKCNNCNGISAYAWTGSVLLFWGKKINFLQIAQDKTKLFVKNLINLSLFLFGALGVIMLAWALLLFIGTGQPFWFFYKARSWQILLFWLSMTSNSYLYYRFQRDVEKIKHIPKKKFDDSSILNSELTWTEAIALDKNKKIDISKYFNEEAHASITKAWELTHKYNDKFTSPIHIFVSLLGFEQTQIIFSRLGVPFNTLKNKIKNTLAQQIPSDKTTVTLSTDSIKILFDAYYLAYRLKERKVDIIDILEAVAVQQNDVNEMLYDLDIDIDKIRNVISWIRVKKQLRANWSKFRKKASLKPGDNMNRSMTAIATPTLDAFSQDLTILAKAGYLMPCIGREKEISDIYKIMQGGTRRSVILIGPPGVGKNTIIEGIAQRMVEEDVPDFLRDKRLVSVSVAKLVSGASASEAQERLLMILSEVRRSGNIILYFDDVSSMVGITAGRQGSIDLADVLSQAMSNNSVLALSTSTPEEYKKYIEGKSSLYDALEPIDIKEVKGNEAIRILQSKVGSFEYRNQVFFSYDAIAKIVELSDRYLHDRYLPEKAIEILQETSSQVRGQKGQDAIITANDVAQIVSEKTNIPLTDITQEETEKLLNLEDKIHERVVDQVEAVSMVASSLRRARADMRDGARPIVNLLFLGPTGVGKTELAKTVAHVYFGAEDNMIRLDMSEYQEKNSINRLIGAPAGMGDSSGGFLSEAVRKNPFSLVLLDEIEKAHPDILNIFLQIMDDGRMTDNNGRTIDFTNVILIATSNAGTRYIQQKVKEGVAVEQIKEDLIDGELQQNFRPEFLNRFDGIIVFKPLSMDDVRQIAKLMLNKIRVNLEDKGISLEIIDSALDELAQAGFDPQFGARPLRRVIQERVQNPLANLLLSNKVKRRDTVVVEGLDKISVKQAKEI